MKSETVTSTLPALLTKGGKELGIYKVLNSSLFCLRFTEGGELPDHLKNAKFLSSTDAYKEGQKYVASTFKKIQDKP